MGCGVIGNTADSGSVVLGSSPGTPAVISEGTGTRNDADVAPGGPPVTEPDPLSVAVLGLGAMGLPMARRLAERLAVTGFDASPDRRSLAADAGIAVRDTARDAVDGAGVVLLAVRNEEQLTDALLGEDGVLPALRPDAVVLLTSTVGV